MGCEPNGEVMGGGAGVFACEVAGVIGSLFVVASVGGDTLVEKFGSSSSESEEGMGGVTLRGRPRFRV